MLLINSCVNGNGAIWMTKRNIGMGIAIHSNIILALGLSGTNEKETSHRGMYATQLEVTGGATRHCGDRSHITHWGFFHALISRALTTGRGGLSVGRSGGDRRRRRRALPSFLPYELTKLRNLMTAPSVVNLAATQPLLKTPLG